MNRLFSLLGLLIAVAIALVSCVTRDDPARALAAVQFLCTEEASLPEGAIYSYGVPMDGVLPLSEEMQAALFGDGIRPVALDEATVGVSYLAYSAPFEITLFCAKSADGAKKLAKMLLHRRDALLRYWQDSTNLEVLPSATVTTYGRWVLLAVTGDAEATAKRLRRAL